MVNLFLDDERYPAEVTWIDIGTGPWTIVRNQNEFEKFIIENGMPDKISFDNDLGDGMGEGRFCADWLINQILDGSVKYRPFSFTVHSWNNIAKEAIVSKLSQFIEHMNERESHA